MIVALMQPYLLPYLGYFQLMHAVQHFVFRDEVQYIKGGWINRNRILVDGGASWLTLPVAKDASTLPIRQRRYQNLRANVAALERRLKGSYQTAPNYPEIAPFLHAVLDQDVDNVATFNINVLVALAGRLGVTCNFDRASPNVEAEGARGQARVLEICSGLGATQYVNAIGGTTLYDAEAFSAHDIRLGFLKSQSSPYPQFKASFVPDLSIIDVLMFNSPERIRELLTMYEVIHPTVGADH